MTFFFSQAVLDVLEFYTDQQSKSLKKNTPNNPIPDIQELTTLDTPLEQKEIKLPPQENLPPPPLKIGSPPARQPLNVPFLFFFLSWVFPFF